MIVKTVSPLLAVGAGGLIAREHVIAVGRWELAPMKRAAREAGKQNRLIDLTFGNACQSVVFFDSGHIALAAADLLSMVVEPTEDDPRTLGFGDG
ncbi:MAG: DUF370 domain-containing protein [Chloroflexi bacterium]|nr:DUF370 domain-containing protein [Chloroflexota bacterium]MBI5081294.1 DUF370 domain-containing protein [Chloroflexota bacterium]